MREPAKALVLAATKFREVSEETRQRREKRETACLKRQRVVDSPRADGEQLLESYVFFSRENDVNFYFDDYVGDWRIAEIVPLAMAQGQLGEVLLDLFAAFHRLRNKSHRHLLNYDRALSRFRRTISVEDTLSRDWLTVLACVLFLAQYEVNARRGKDLGTHLTFAASILQQYRHEPLTEARQRLLQTLTRIAMTYDLQHFLVFGDKLHLEIEHYLEMLRTSTMNPFRPDPRASLNQLWSMTHYLWAQFAAMVNAEIYAEKDLRYLCTSLNAAITMHKHDILSIGHESPLFEDSPFGSAILYKTPAHRLNAVNLHALVLLVCSWYPQAHEFFDSVASRNHIMRLQVPFVKWKRYSRPNENDRFVHQIFPAMLLILLGASEIGQEEPACQEWVAFAVKCADEHGYDIGKALLFILQSRKREGEQGLWSDIGCRAFLSTCRYFRSQGIV